MSSVILLCLMICITLVCSDDKFILLYGETQAGKSSMVNALFGKKVAPIEDTGYSVTAQSAVYPKKFKKNSNIPQDFTLHIMDTPGNLDNRAIMSEEDIINNILFALSQTATEQIDVIFFTESLAESAIQFTRNILKIVAVFGKSVTSSMVVLGTKSDRKIKIDGVGKYNDRVKQIKKACDAEGVKYLEYDSAKTQNYKGQLKLFMDMIFDHNITPYKMEKVKHVRQQIEANAQRLMVEAPQKYEIIKVPHQVIKYKEVKRQEKYWDRRWGEVGRGGRRYGLFGPKKRIDGWIPVERTRTITEQKPYEVTEMRDKKVKIPKEIETFRAMAKEQWKKSLKLKVNLKKEL